ncbi:MAG TPA: transposase [Ktedonobacteraceae bacterium]|nr:transposase [Ktedonobacteraceae bacterium]
MNESTTPATKQFSSCASLAAIGIKLRDWKVFEPIEQTVQIAQKTIKDSPTDKLYDAFISILAGAQGLVEINTRLRADAALQRAFGRSRCAEQSVVQDTLNACTAENVEQMERALDTIYRRHSQGSQHDYQADYQILDVDMSGLPCGPKAAFATKGYFAKQRNRRGRQLGRVLASRYQEVVVDRLFDGKTQLTRALQPLMLAAECTLHLDEDTRSRTIVRVDAGGGSLDDVNWLLARGYQVQGKDYSGQQAKRLASTVEHWFTDPQQPERQFGWVTEVSHAYVRPVKRVAVRCHQQDGQFAYGVLLSTLPAQHVLVLTGQQLSVLEDPAAVLLAYVTFYDQRGGGVETSFKSDKQGLGIGKRSKKRFAAQQLVMLLGTLAHNVIVWARHWLTSPTLQHYGTLRMVRDVFHISGFLLTDACGQIVQIVLNQSAPLASALVHPLRELLLCAHVAINLGQT